MVRTKTLELQTRGSCDMHDITGEVSDFVRGCGITSGAAVVFVPGATAGVTTIEYEPGLVRDFRELMERLAPERAKYAHDERWGDGNGHSHLRASLLGPSLSVPFSNGALTLGTWQQIIVVDFDNRPRRREVVLQVIGE